MKNDVPLCRKSRTNSVSLKYLCFLVLGSLRHIFHDDVSADASVKESILTLTTKKLTFCNGENGTVNDLLYSVSCPTSNFTMQSICLG